MERYFWDVSLLLSFHTFTKSSQAKIFDRFVGGGAQHMILMFEFMSISNFFSFYFKFLFQTNVAQILW